MIWIPEYWAWSEKSGGFHLGQRGVAQCTSARQRCAYDLLFACDSRRTGRATANDNRISVTTIAAAARGPQTMRIGGRSLKPSKEKTDRVWYRPSASFAQMSVRI